MHTHLIRQFVAIVLVALITALTSGCSIMGAAAGARIDSNALEYIPVEPDSLVTVVPGDTIRVCVHEFRGQRKNEQAIFESFDPGAGIIHGLDGQAEMSYLLSEIEGVDLVRRAGPQHTGEIVGFTLGLAIDIMVVSELMDGTNWMGDGNWDWNWEEQ